MKVNAGENSIFTSQQIQSKRAVERTEGAASFASVLAGQASTAESSSTTADAQSKSYDFTHMTPSKLHETVNGLIRSGQMDLDESTGLVGLMPSALSKVNYDGGLPADANQPINVFNKIQESITGALLRNDRESADSLQLASDTLRRFQGQVASISVRA